MRCVYEEKVLLLAEKGSGSLAGFEELGTVSVYF